MRIYRSELEAEYPYDEFVEDSDYVDEDDTFYDRPEFDDNRFMR